MHSLDRFTRAQDDPATGFDSALAELRSGRKRSHWIWYVFPQLRGLGNSPAAQTYGISGVPEAEAYLRDPVLCARLLSAATAALDQLRAGIPLSALMGARIDVLKLVSSMTLFGATARRLSPSDPTGALATLADTADALLAIAEAEGYPRCAYTQQRMADC
jgi:uncharacterized protein (DUF1810 family)